MMTEDFAELHRVLGAICPVDPKDETEARHRLDSLTKPIGSLGRLETIAAQLFSIYAGEIPLPLRRAIYVFAADHGVTAEGVSAYPSEVTAQMVQNFLNGGAAISVLARMHHADLTVVDVGVDAVLEEAPGLCRMKVRRGSRNMRREPAMTAQEMIAALNAGIRLAQAAAERGENLIAVGEMGIGNTTPASAITSVLVRQPVAAVTGRGAGLDADGRNRKLNVIRRSIKLHFGEELNPDPLDMLRCVGGLEIAAMTGFILGAAACRIAVVCDGFIATAAAAIAHALCPHVCDFLFAGHCSEEPGHRFLLRRLGLAPILNLGMRLGEGTGAVLAMPLIESSVRLMMEMATFSSAGVSEATQ
ncbi:MAG TPA: nicotinate-nucleotide--dimethylbenzimidazole phosphoribosyltransferase [Acidobacteriaceae bacterium]|jgi:nicotinate-nucleotide--dimethylbenzimidazole phosphoribosyltransferase|nr:nicotinate-nucleotide--dimethylbenzimidazole phosphoribosyltransferase [Acidobacteriaceae bacterium]